MQKPIIELNTPKYEEYVIDLGLDYDDSYLGVEQLFTIQSHVLDEMEVSEWTTETISEALAVVVKSMRTMIDVLIDNDVSYKIVSKLEEMVEEYVHQYSEGVNPQKLEGLNWENTTLGEFNRFKDKVNMTLEELDVIRAVLYETGTVDNGRIHETLISILFGG